MNSISSIQHSTKYNKIAKCIVWVADDDDSIRWVLEKALVHAGFDCVCFESGQKVIEALEISQPKPSVILSDIRMPGLDGLSLLGHMKENYGDIPVIIMTAHSDLDAAVNAYQKGAFEYIPKPFDVDDVIALLERATAQEEDNIEDAVIENTKNTGIIGEAPAMQEVFRAIGRLSKSSINVLINGESGTGKELIAQALHQHSPRANHSFIALNMAAIPKELIESELFGHEKGAFTGANQLRHGRFEQANGGTLFLDEIGDMPFDVQTRLLRVLSDGQFYRVGGYSPIKVDVRIIAATHQDLETRVKQGLFREDLYHRLNVIRILLPALKERAEDIPNLVTYFLQKSANELGVDKKVLSVKTMDIFCRYSWPGNVRQLENICRWVTVMASTQTVLEQDLPTELLQQTSTSNPLKNTKLSLEEQNNNLSSDLWPQLLKNWAEQALKAGETNILDEAVRMVEQVLIAETLEFTQGKKKEAAELLGWGRNTLTRKLKELQDSKDG